MRGSNPLRYPPIKKGVKRVKAELKKRVVG